MHFSEIIKLQFLKKCHTFFLHFGAKKILKYRNIVALLSILPSIFFMDSNVKIRFSRIVKNHTQILLY